jgi:plasmid stability protein
MQYTIRNIPPAVDEALRRKAERERKSLNEVAVELLAQALGVGATAPRRRDLGDMAGSWIDDPKVDEALDEQRRIDPELPWAIAAAPTKTVSSASC